MVGDDRDDDQSRELLTGQHNDPKQLELFFIESVRLEDRRLDAAGERTALAKQAMELNDAQDQRYAEHARLQLESTERADVRRHRLMVWVLLCGGGGIGLLLMLFFGMLFYGTPAQSASAAGLLDVLGKGAAGAGIALIPYALFRRLWKI